MRTNLVKKHCILFLILTMLATVGFAQKKEIALTIDDLPFVGEQKNFHLNMILDSLKTNRIPATGFVIAREINTQNWQMLQKFREAGLGLGNHTFSHKNLNKVDSKIYIQEIETADKILAPLLTEPKFFRYPYLAMSEGEKKNKVIEYLSNKNYHIAPITIDSRDFVFNQLLMAVPQNKRRDFLEALKPCYLNFIWQQTLLAEENNRSAHKTGRAQILLIHANLLNAYSLPDIINLYKEHGYTFVSLGQALNSTVPVVTKRIAKNNSILDTFFAWD